MPYAQLLPASFEKYPAGQRVDAVCDAFEQEWIAGNTPRVEDFLSLADEESRAALLTELLAVEVDYRSRLGPPPQRDEYLRRFPEHADPVEAAFARSTARSQRDTAAYSQADAPTNGAKASARRAASPAKAGEIFGDYELLEEIARGGMGVVFKARHARLNRIVALKMILAGRMADEQEVLRFQAEAQAAANLDHPGIVPVYEVGEVAGQHFFSMGFVEGQSLSKRIAAGPLSPREAAGLLKTIAEAVEYAHGKGVIHRDLKPANILLAQAEARSPKAVAANQNAQSTTSASSFQPPASGLIPRVTDFGLAKQVGKDSGLTATGQVMGTPSYMPPEQAEGRIADIGPRSDVYSLGAVLYHCLTGHPPFQAANIVETLRFVVERDPVPPRRFNPAIDLDVQTICLKCLEKSPERRYGSAGEVAADLRRYLQHEPIVARPLGITARSWRWCRRKPGIAALLGLAAVLLIGGVSGILWQWRQADAARDEAQTNFLESEARGRKLAAALDNVSQERDRADQNLLQTEEVVHYFLTQSADSQELIRTAGTQALRSRLLARAKEHYLSIVEQSKNERTSIGLARSLWRLGLVQYDMDELKEAQGSLDSSLKIWDELCAGQPDFAEYERGRAACQGILAMVHEKLGDDEEAGRWFARALERPLPPPAPGMDPQVREFVSTRASTHVNFAGLHARFARLDEAIDHTRQAIALLEVLALDEGKERFVDALANARNNLGLFLGRQGDLAGSLREHKLALPLAEQLVSVYGESPDSLATVALVLHNLSAAHGRLGQSDEAITISERSYALFDRLVRENPQVPELKSRLVSVVTNLSMWLRRSGDLPRAEKLCQQAIPLAKEMAEANPANSDRANALATMHNNYGVILEDSARMPDASRQYAAAVEIRERLLAAQPDNAQVGGDLIGSYVNLGNAQRNANELELARATYEKGKALAERLSAAHPDVPDYQNEVGGCYNSLGQLDLAKNDFAGAAKNMEEAVAIGRALSEAQPDNVEFQVRLGKRFNNLGVAYAGQGELEKALAAYQEAGTRWDKLIALEPATPGYQVELIFTCANMANLAAQQKNAIEAREHLSRARTLAEELVEKYPSVPYFESVLERLKQQETVLFAGETSEG